jgi:hypothetical protein
VEKFLAKPDVIYQQTFQSTVYKMLEIEENRDIFNISFIAWLVSRWEKNNPVQNNNKNNPRFIGGFTDKNDVMTGLFVPIT